MRLEDRGRVKPGDRKPGPGRLRQVFFDNITGDDCGPRGSYLIGIPERPIEDVLFRDFRVKQRASRRPAVAGEVIGEMRGVYPDAHMIDSLGDAPAYALWARHVHGLSLKRFIVTAEEGEKRPEFVLETDVEMDEKP